MSVPRKPLTFDVDTAPAAVQRPVEPRPSKGTTQAEPRKQTGARIDAATYRQLKARAAMQNQTIGELIDQIITEFLARPQN